MNQVTLIVKATINKEEINSFNTYIQNLLIDYQKVNAKKVAQYNITETFIGNETPTFIAVYEFPDMDAFKSIYESKNYVENMIPLRDKAFKSLEVYLSQV